jgi:hypothetical protein
VLRLWLTMANLLVSAAVITGGFRWAYLGTDDASGAVESSTTRVERLTDSLMSQEGAS